MTTMEFLIGELDSEAARTRRTLERVPEGRDDWKPHDKSMALGRLAGLVAMMPSWLSMIVNTEELDVVPKPGSQPQISMPRCTPAELVKAHDEAVAGARAALQGTTEDHPKKPWRLIAAGKMMSSEPRYVALRDSLNHLAHHRGQLSVYLRLNDVPVPSIYGPTADDQRFL